MAPFAALLAALLVAGCAARSAQVPTKGPDRVVAPAPSPCLPNPLAPRDLYLRGDFNGWAARPEHRLRWQCDHFGGVVDIVGEHHFKVGDEDWSPDADFGAAEGRGAGLWRLKLRGENLNHRFDGPRTLTMSSPTHPPIQLTIAECPPAPLGDIPLYLLGSMNAGMPAQPWAFRYVCDAYYLTLTLQGEHRFRIADAASATAATVVFSAPRAGAVTLAPDEALPLREDRSAAGTPATALGGELVHRFQGAHTLRLAWAGGRPVLTIGDQTRDDGTPLPVTEPVAASLRHDSRDLADRSPFGAVPAGTEVAFALAALPGVRSATLVIERRRLEGNQDLLAYTELARVPLQAEADGAAQRWRGRYRFTEPAVYGYWFDVVVGDRHYAVQNNRDAIFWTREVGSNGAGVVDPMPRSAKGIRRYRITVHDPAFQVPDWAQDAVYYYIFPDRFRNGDKANDPRPGIDRYHDASVEMHPRWLERPYKPGTGDGSDAVYNNDFFGGDIAGIVAKLDHIAALGANTLYITPMFRAASNHKYDTADYRHIDPHVGNDDDFNRLCIEAARRGIRVIPDTSLNHVGNDSVYFDRFGNFSDHPGGPGAFAGGRIHPESPYASWFRFDTTQTDPDKQVKGWVGVADLPELDKASASFRDFAYRAPDSVMKRWLDRGAAGWRMDVAPWVPDDFWREWRTEIKRHRPDALTIAETWFDSSKYLLGDTFDSAMNYIFRNTVLAYAGGGDAARLYANIEFMREAYPPQAFHALMNLLSTHDQPRSLHVLGWPDDAKHRAAEADAATVARAKQRFRLAVLFQMGFPGAPAIYYGDEVGMTGGEDPYNRGPFPWADEGGDPDLAMQAWFQRLTAMRRDHAVLRRGSLGAPLFIDAQVIVLGRHLDAAHGGGETWAITATNNGDDARSLRVPLPAGAAGRQFVDALSGQTAAMDDGQLLLNLPAVGGVVLISR
jgi:glycosidase